MTMAEEGFLRRWARRKTAIQAGIEPASEIAVESVAARATVAEAAPALQPAPAQPVVLPTMDDVAQLTSESDFSAFVARGVDQAVRRSALKKLFADPHFNVMDKLDMYMDDYNVASPMPEGMLASLKHSKSFFDQAAEEARKRAEAQARAEAAAVLEASPPYAAEPGLAGHAQVLPPEDVDEPAGSVEAQEALPVPPGARIESDSAVMMQKQP